MGVAHSGFQLAATGGCQPEVQCSLPGACFLSYVVLFGCRALIDPNWVHREV
jgi:hypothetical protein